MKNENLFVSCEEKMEEEMMFVLEVGDLLFPGGKFKEELKCIREEIKTETKYEDEQEKEVQKLREAHLKFVENSLYGSLSHGFSGNLFFAKGFKSFRFSI